MNYLLPGCSIMKQICALLFTIVVAASSAVGQRDVKPFPQAVFVAKTVAIINNTHNDAVGQGAVEALRRWGKLSVIADPDLADMILVFDEKSQHEGSSSQQPDKDGKPSSSYSMSFSSSVFMKASLKDAPGSFYTASTSESKKKAGDECVRELEQAYLNRP